MTDFVIVGGGVYGAATAWSLARQGADVHLIDKGRIAGRASGGPGRRGVRANGRDVRELALMKAAYEMWPDLHEQLDAPPFYERTGQLQLFEHDADRDRASAQVWLQQSNGIASELLDRAQVRALEPDVSDDIQGAIYCPNDGVADHGATTRAFARAASRAGASIEEGVVAERIEPNGDRAEAVLASTGARLVAKRAVLVLANSEVAELVSPWVTLPVWNQAVQVIVSEPMSEVPFRHLLGHASRVVSLKTEGDDRIMISGGWPGRWDPEHEQGHTLPESVAGNVAEAIKVFPALNGLGVALSDANHLESMCIDDVPVIDAPSGLSNLLYATGWCGHGWAIAPVIAELLAEWALTGRRPALLEPFAHRRFESHSS